MNDKNNEITLKRFVLQNLFAISAVVVAVVNLWFLTKLLPITQSIQALESRVLANEQTDELVWGELKYIRERVDEIYNNLH